jgi:hypothetical protein
MANTNIVRGLKATKTVDGRPFSTKAVFIGSGVSAGAFIGEPVLKLAAGSNSARLFNKYLPGTLQSVTPIASATSSVTGVVTGFDVETDESPIYGVGATNRVAFVIDPTNVIFEIQGTNGIPSVADVGLNASFALGSGGSTVTGLSSVSLDIGTLATTAGLPMKVIGFSEIVGDEVAANAKYLVMINAPTEFPGIAGI